MPVPMPVEWLPPIEDYVQARRCPECGATPWAACDWAEPQEDVSWGGASHAKRVDGGISHMRRDVTTAPWAEHCEPGQVLHSITYPDGRAGPMVRPVVDA